jgi:hypothetical protein
MRNREKSEQVFAHAAEPRISCVPLTLLNTSGEGEKSFRISIDVTFFVVKHIRETKGFCEKLRKEKGRTKGGVRATLDDLQTAEEGGRDRLSPGTGDEVEERVTTKDDGPEGQLGAKKADARYSGLDDRETDELNDDESEYA